MRFTREFYISPGEAVTEYPEANMTIARSNYKGRFAVKLFYGKQAKYERYNVYKTEEAREAEIQKYLEGGKARVAYMAKRKEERKAFQPSLKVGDILSTSWGYDQTNVEFYEVVEAAGKSVVVRELSQDRKEQGWLSGQTSPVPGKYVGPPIRKLVLQGNSLKMSDWGRYATIYKGGTTYWSAYA